MKVRRKTSPAKKRPSRRKTHKPAIRVQLSNHPTVLQPSETFRVCPLGLQFYSPKKIPDFKVMNFRMQMAPGNGEQEEVTCSGVVVHCQKEKATGLYRVWVKFLDLAKDNGARLECAAKNADTICPHCENF